MLHGFKFLSACCYRCFIFSYSAATHFWLCFLSWLLLSIFVYMVYMPFMCLFLECLFGFIFMISCIFKCLKLGFIFALSHSLSLSTSLCLYIPLSCSAFGCVWAVLAVAYALVNAAIDDSFIQMFSNYFHVFSHNSKTAGVV